MSNPPPTTDSAATIPDPIEEALPGRGYDQDVSAVGSLFYGTRPDPPALFSDLKAVGAVTAATGHRGLAGPVAPDDGGRK